MEVNDKPTSPSRVEEILALWDRHGEAAVDRPEALPNSEVRRQAKRLRAAIAALREYERVWNLEIKFPEAHHEAKTILEEADER